MTVETYTDDKHPNVRVRLVLDTNPSEPDGDALAPTVRVSTGGRMFRSASAAFATGPYQPTNVSAGDVAKAWERWGDWGHVGRYLRMFHGATAVEYITPHDGGDTFVIFDTPDFREHVGVTETPTNLEGEVNEWRAWVEGDVYGVIVETRATTATVVRDGATGDVIREENGEMWEHEDACFGYFGREYAESEARSQLAAYIKDTAGE